MADSEGRRSKRNASKTTTAKKKALDQIRKFRETGEKVGYEVDEEDTLYELVDEDRYAQIVQERQEEDFIVDDDGTGYVDDGRELYDDDPNEEPPPEAAKEKIKKKEANTVKSAKITNMFGANANIKRKKKENTVTNEGDADLEDILNSLNNSKSSSITKTKSRKPETRTPKRLNKHPPRRLEDEKKITFKTKSHLMGGQHAFKQTDTKKIKQEEEESSVDVIEDDYAGESCDDIPEMPVEEASETCDDAGYQSQPKLKPSVKIEDDLMEDDLDKALTADMAVDNFKSEVNEVVEEKAKDWDNLFDDNEKEPIPSIDFSSSSTLPTTKVDGVDVLRFFWIDAFEDRYHQPGTVFLFGKVWIEASKCHVSCCVAVKNIQRQLYVLPRETRVDKNGKDLGTPVEFKDVYNEFNEKIASKYQLMEFKCKKTFKKYTFEKTDIPKEHEYFEVIYPQASGNQLPSDLKGETFRHVFGTNTSSLELLFLNQKLHGPSWIDIKYPQVPKQPLSWCKVEAFVDRPSFVFVIEENIPPPPLTVLSLSMLTMSQGKAHSHEIISLSGLVHQEVRLDKGAPDKCFNHGFCFVTKPSNQLLPFDFQQTVQKMKANINICGNERAMLGLFLARVQTIDPDVIVGHDIHGFDFDVLLHRFGANKVPHWSKIGRLRRTNLPKSVNSSKNSSNMVSEKYTACGRLVCDLKISSKELIRCKSYDLTEIVSVVLNKSREDLLSEDVPVKFMKTNSLLNMIQNTRMDAMFNLQLMYELNVLPLAYQITGICGNVMSRTLLGGRSERNEFLLLHAFSKKDFIVPDKVYGNKNKAVHTNIEVNGDGMDDDGGKKRTGKGRKKPSYAGGLVLEPKKGFYDKYILLLDFNSLYPSIIQEYNICFTTVTPPPKSASNNDEEQLPDVPEAGQDVGILPTEIRTLVERRKQVKQLLKSVPVGSDLYLQYDIRQKALKLTANSMYGCLGFSHSRFYAKPLAALVTGKGREILMKTKDLASALGLDVIYGDTDSIMINTNSQDLKEVKKIGSKVKSEVNKLYRLVEIDIDGIFKSMLLLKKKKYAAVMVEMKDDGTVVERMEMKGLDIVRRDWSGLAKEAGKYVLQEILSGSHRDVVLENIHDYLRNLREKLDAGQIESEKFEINKGLTKNPDEYPDKKSLPHVTVALRLLSQGRRVAVGDTISYIICDDSTNLPSSQRAYHPDECAKNINLKIDNHYYLSSQVHPVVSRLCDPIEGTDSAFIAQCLGLDASQYKTKTHQAHDAVDSSLTVLMTDEERFKEVEKFYVRCLHETCKQYKQEVEFKGSFDAAGNPLACSSCKKSYNINRMANSLQLFIREKISKYFKCWLTCDDPTCGYVCRHISVKSFKSQHQCQQCRKGNLQVEYSDTALYNQLYYFVRLFDTKKLPITVKNNVDFPKDEFTRLHNVANKALSRNAYSTISFSNLFT